MLLVLTYFLKILVKDFSPVLFQLFELLSQMQVDSYIKCLTELMSVQSCRRRIICLAHGVSLDTGSRWTVGGKNDILNLKHTHQKNLVIEVIKWKWKNLTYIRFSVDCSTACSEVFSSVSTDLIQLSLQSVQCCSCCQHEVGMFIMVGCFESFNGKKRSFTYL